jgi:hypothetical protein
MAADVSAADTTTTKYGAFNDSAIQATATPAASDR